MTLIQWGELVEYACVQWMAQVYDCRWPDGRSPLYDFWCEVHFEMTHGSLFHAVEIPEHTSMALRRGKRK